MKRCASLLLVVAVTMLLAVAGAHAQGGKFSVQFDDTPLSRVLDALKRFDPNFQFALAPDLGQTGITASLVDVTVDEALQIVLAQAGLQSVKDAGVYQIRQKPEAKGARVERPSLRLPPPVFVNRPVTPGAGDAAAGAAPAAGSAAATAAAAAQKANPPLRLILMRFEDPALFGEPYGGSYSQTGGGSGGGGGYGGSGGGGGYGGSGGSSRSGGSSGRSSGSSSRSSGSSSRSSGSSRGGSY